MRPATPVAYWAFDIPIAEVAIVEVAAVPHRGYTEQTGGFGAILARRGKCELDHELAIISLAGGSPQRRV
jgi:hypothetical protein